MKGEFRLSPTFSLAKKLAMRDILGRVVHCLTEAVFNCYAYGKKKVQDQIVPEFWAVSASHPKLRDFYLLVACHNDGPKSLDELLDIWLPPHISAMGRVAMRGCGIGLSGFCSSSPGAEHTVVAAKLPNGDLVVGRVDFTRDGSAVCKDVTKQWAPIVRKWMGKDALDKYDVIYLFPFPRQITIPELDETIEVAKNSASGGFVTTQVMNSFARLLGNKTPYPEIHYARGIIVGPDRKIPSLSACMSGPLSERESRLWYCNADEYRRRYSLDSRKIDKTVKITTKEDGEEQEWVLGCSLELEFFLGLQDRHHRRLLNLRDGDGVGQSFKRGVGDEYGERPPSDMRRGHRAPNIVMTVPSIADLAREGDRDVCERLRSYAVWYYPTLSGFLTAFAGGYHANRPPKFNDRDEWPDFQDIWQSGATRSPFILMSLSVESIQSLKTSGEKVEISEFSFDTMIDRLFGSPLLENFRLAYEDTAKKVVQDICDAIADSMSEDEKQELREKFERLYPLETQDEVAIKVGYKKRKSNKSPGRLWLMARRLGNKKDPDIVRKVRKNKDYESKFVEADGTEVKVRKSVSDGWNLTKI